MNADGKRFTEEEKQIINRYILQGVQDGLANVVIQDKLMREQGISIAKSYIYYLISNIKKSLITNQSRASVKSAPKMEVKKKDKYTPAQKQLYYGRTKVVDMYKCGYSEWEIAQSFGVKESDVIEFLSKRKKLNEEQCREIIFKSTKGATIFELANEYGVSENVIKKIVLTAQKAISSEYEPEDKTKQEFDLNVAKNFIKFINTLTTYKELCTDDAIKLDKQRQDILHELELKELTQQEKLEMLDRIAELSRQRRSAKDYNEIFEPVTEFMSDEDNMRCIKTFANKVGEAVNKMKDAETRVYFLRSE